MQSRALPAESDRGVDRFADLSTSPLGAACGGDLELVALLGSGATAEAWHARDARGRSLVLKLLRPAWRNRENAHALLLREHATLTVLRHPHIVTSFGIRTHAGMPALVLERVAGGDLVALTGGPPRTWLRAARELIAALRHVHDCGFVHRDLKARNVLLDSHDRVRLADFASALPLGAPVPRGGTTAAHVPLGPAPEHADRAEDCYALAVLLHELLTGRLPAAGAPLVSLATVDASIRRLVDLITGTLATRGRSPEGLLAFGDVIESAIAAHS